MTDVTATFGPPMREIAAEPQLHNFLHAGHTSQTPGGHCCIIAQDPPLKRYRPRLNWLIPTLIPALISSILIASGSGNAFGTVLGALPTQPSIEVSSALFPQAVPGFDQEQGLTLPSAPLAEDSTAGRGVRSGGVFVQPSLDLGIGYDSNVLGARGGSGGAILSQTPAVSLTTQGSVVRVGAFLDAEKSTYLDQPRQSRTDYRAAIGTTADLGKNSLTFGYSHLYLHDDPAAIGSIAAGEPTPYDVDDLRLSGRIELGRLSVLPFGDFSHWSYGHVRIGGIDTDQSVRNRSLIQVGSAARLVIGEQRDLLASLSFVSTQYDRRFGASDSPSSIGVLALGGVDYELDATLRARVLAGLQARVYTSRFNRSQMVAVGQLALTWLPQKQTEVSLAISRSLEDLAQEDPGGTIYARAELAVRHEYLRNFVLRARTGITSVEFLQIGSTQTSGYVGSGFEWDITRHWRLVGNAQVSRVSSPVRILSQGSQGVAGGPYTRVQTGLRLVAAL